MEKLPVSYDSILQTFPTFAILAEVKGLSKRPARCFSNTPCKPSYSETVEGHTYVVVTPDSAAQTRVFGNVGVYGSRGYTASNKVNDAGGALEFLLVDARNTNNVKDGVASIKSEDVGELTIDAEVLSTTGELTLGKGWAVKKQAELLDSPASVDAEGNLTVNGKTTLNNDVDIEGYTDVITDDGRLTQSISLGAIRIYVSTIGGPSLSEPFNVSPPIGSLFINTADQLLSIYAGESVGWKNFKF